MKTRKLLIATRNHGKFPEITAGLEGLPLECINLSDIPELPADYEVEEPGSTFEGNAIIKAMTLGKKAGMLTLAEDAGLVIDALDGRPGVYSARYGPGSDKDRYEKVLAEMLNVPEPKRQARYVAVIAIYDPQNDKIRLCEGVSEGKILKTATGSRGFGYDPIFYSDKLGKSNAEMSISEKNSVSHRGLALLKAREILLNEFAVDKEAENGRL